MADSPVELELALCKAFGICIELCPEEVFDRDKLGYPVIARPDECSQCLICELHCLNFAIEVRRRMRKDKASAAAGASEGAGAEGAHARRPHRRGQRRRGGRRRLCPQR